jgi:hypothetical protein
LKDLPGQGPDLCIPAGQEKVLLNNRVSHKPSNVKSAYVSPLKIKSKSWLGSKNSRNYLSSNLHDLLAVTTKDENKVAKSSRLVRIMFFGKKTKQED